MSPSSPAAACDLHCERTRERSPGSQRKGGDLRVTLIDAAPRPGLEPRLRRFSVEVCDGCDLATANWPSIEAGPEFLMHVFQSREFLEVWMATIGRARNARCFLIIVKDVDDQPVLYLPLSIETRFNAR